MAIARDPNDQYYPLAFGVVETESKENWRWFLKKLLMEDIGEDRNYVFISDQQRVKNVYMFMQLFMCVNYLHVY